MPTVGALAITNALEALGASPFAGAYTGIYTVQYSGVVTVPETGFGPAYLTVDEAGVLGSAGARLGTVSNAGVVTWDTPNQFYFDTGQIADGLLTSEGTHTENGLTTTYRLRAENAAGGFGGTVASNLAAISPTPNRDEIYDLIHDGSRFVAVTASRTILVSADGSTWEEHPVPATDRLNAIAFGNGTYVVVGDAGNAFYSADLDHWTPISLSGNNFLNREDIAFGSGLFAMVSLTGGISTSPDGAAWTSAASVGGAGSAIDYVNGRFIAGGRPFPQGTYQTITSIDGVTWSAPATTTLRPARHDAAFGNGTYVLGVGNRVLTSPDAMSWTERDPGRRIDAVAFDGSVFIGVGGQSIATSPDGIAWTSVATADTNNAVAVNGTTYLAAGRQVAKAGAADSWTEISTDLFAAAARSVDTLSLGAAGNGYLLVRGNVLGGGVGDGAMGRSVDGVAWEVFDEPDSPARMVFGNGIFAGIRSVYNSANGTTTRWLTTSMDGSGWHDVSSIPSDITRLFFANGTFICFTTGPNTTFAMQSADAIHWQLAAGSFASEVYSFTHLVYGEGAYVALAANGRVYRSTDLLDWTLEVDIGTTAYGLAAGNGKLVVVGSNAGTGGDARLFVSGDGGRSWTNKTPAIDNETIGGVTFAGGRFVAFTSPRGDGYQTLISSGDGEFWIEEDAHVDASLTGILGFGQGFLLSDQGSRKILLRSGFNEAKNPEVSVAPAEQAVVEGETFTLTASVAGEAPLSLRWTHRGIPVADSARISGAAAASLTVTGVTASDAGDYRLSVTDANGSVLSDTANVTVITVPQLATQPGPRTVLAGSDLVLSVDPGDATATVLWFRGELQVGSGATLTIPAVTAAEAGWYHAEVSNAAGTTATQPFSVSVVGNPNGVSVDPGFSADGSVFSGVPWITGAVELPNGAVIVWGWFDVTLPGGGSMANIAMFGPDGAFVEDFAPQFNSGVSGVVYHEPSNSLVVGGPFTTTNGLDVPSIAHLDLSGNLLSTPPRPEQIFNGQTFAADVNAVSMDTQGRIYINGFFTHVDGVPREHILRLLVEESARGYGLVVDTSFSTAGLQNAVYPARFQSNGQMVGYYHHTKRLLRFLDGGPTDPAFTSADTGLGAFGTDALAVDGQDRIYNGGGVGGSFSYPRLVRVGADGSLDGTFAVTFDSSGTDRFKTVEGTLAISDNLVLVGGTFSSINGLPHAFLSAVDGSGADAHATLDIGSGPDSHVVSIRRGRGNHVFVVGGFQHVDGVERPYVLRLLAGGADVDLAIVADPVDVTAIAGSTAVLSLSVTGNLPLAVDWYKDGQFYRTTSEPILRIEAVGGTDAGDYHAVVSDAGGAPVTSGAATLTVNPAPPMAGELDVAGTNAGPTLMDGTAEAELLDGQVWKWTGGNTFARYNGDGTVDGTYDPGVEFAAIHEVAVDADGLIYVAGRGTNAGGGAPDRWSLVRLDRHGNRDASFDTGTGFANGSANVYAVQPLPDGRVVAAGRFAAFDGTAVFNYAILLHGGGLDPDFAGAGQANGGASDILDIELASDGTLLLAGEFGAFPGTLNNCLVNVDQRGEVVGSFNFPLGANMGFYNGTTVAPRIDRVEETLGTIIAVGRFTAFGGEPAGNIVALMLDTARRDQRFDFGAGFNGEVTGLDVSFTGDIVAAGSFTTYRGQSVPSPAAIHGLPIDLLITTQPAGVTVGVDEDVELSVEVFSKSPVGYQWLKDGAELPGATEPVLQLNDVSRADMGSYRVVVTNDTSETVSAPASVRVVDAPEFDLQPHDVVAMPGQAVRLSPVVVGAGSLSFQWFRNGVELPGAVSLELELPAVGPDDAGFYHLVASNSFGSTATHSATVSVAAAAFGAPDTGFQPGSGIDNGEIYAFQSLPDGSLLVGGSFSSYQGVAVQSLIRVDASGALDLTFKLGNGFAADSTVYGMGRQSDGGVIVAGDFTSYGGQARTNLLRLDADGALDGAFNPSATFTFDGHVDDLLMLGDDIVVVGDFTGGIARFSHDGILDASFGNGGANGRIRTIARMSDGRLAIGGDFTSYGGVQADYLAYIAGNDGSFSAAEADGLLQDVVYGLAGLPDGSVLGVGEFRKLARFLADASVDLSYLGLQANTDEASEIVALPNGRIVIGGDIYGDALAAFTADGSPIAGLPVLERRVFALEVDLVGRLLIGGDFTDSDGDGRRGLTRWFAGGPPVRVDGISENSMVPNGSSQQVKVVASGTAPLTYQWFRGQSGDEGEPISGAEGSVLDTGPITAAVSFWVRVTDAFDSVDSRTVTVQPVTAPALTAQPGDTDAVAGETLDLTVAFTGGGTVEVRWRHDGQILPGVTGATLALDPVTPSDAGVYTVEVSNEAGTVTSSPWTVTVNYRIEVQTEGPGRVTPGSGLYPAGSSLTLTAVPTSPYYEFVMWRDAAARERHGTLSFEVDEHRTVVAEFGLTVPPQWAQDNHVADLDSDQDGDGLTARQEYGLGTDPDDDGSNIVQKDLQLLPNWNLISLPVQPAAGTEIDDVLGNGPIGRIWWWNALEGTYDFGGQAIGRRGYWLFLAEAVPPVTVTGQIIRESRMVLFTGWNLIGPSADGVLAPNPDVAPTLWYWSAPLQRYMAVTDGQLREGFGYWALATKDTEAELQ